MKIQQRDPGKLVPYENNPRSNDGAVDAGGPPERAGLLEQFADRNGVDTQRTHAQDGTDDHDGVSGGRCRG